MRDNGRDEESHGAPLSILLVDDSPVVTRTLSRRLSAFPKLRVAIASDGLEAVEHVQAKIPDLVVMDLQMPRMSGLEATRRIRSSLPRLKIILSSVHDEDAVRLASLASGADLFVRKTELCRRLLTCIRKWFPERALE